METDRPSGPHISKDEAADALAAVADSRAKVRWADYPAWFWVGTGIGMAGLPASDVLPEWWDLLGSAVAAGLLIATVVALTRVRRIRESQAMTAEGMREFAWRFSPILVVMLAGAVLPRFGLWWAPLAAAGLVLVIWTGTGLLTSTRPARR